MCGALSWSRFTRIGRDQDAPPLAEKDSQPTSCPCRWESQVTYRLPPVSRPIEPSIHHSRGAMDVHPGPTRTGDDQVTPPSAEVVKKLCAGPRVSVAGSV